MALLQVSEQRLAGSEQKGAAPLIPVGRVGQAPPLTQLREQ
jgi:hypothetical protein